MADKIEELYKWFDTNREEIIKEHYGKQVLIHEQKAVGYFEDFTEALKYAKNANFTDGEFIIQDCLTIKEEAEANRLGWFNVATA